jgi:hypothetical protein
MDERTSFFARSQNKSFLMFIPGAMLKNFLWPQVTSVRNKLESLTQASLSRLIEYLRARPEPTLVKQHSIAAL